MRFRPGLTTVWAAGGPGRAGTTRISCCFAKQPHLASMNLKASVTVWLMEIVMSIV